MIGSEGDHSTGGIVSHSTGSGEHSHGDSTAFTTK